MVDLYLSFYGLNAPSWLFDSHPLVVALRSNLPAAHRFADPAPVAAPPVPAAVSVVAVPAPPFAKDPALLALPGPATVPTTASVIAAPALALAAIVGSIPAQFAGAPRLSVIGSVFPGFPAGYVPLMQINARDTALQRA